MPDVRRRELIALFAGAGGVAACGAGRSRAGDAGSRISPQCASPEGLPIYAPHSIQGLVETASS